jgi:glyoxylase-like metal-dependent hydrolase (beta-lactamase superfamily II)
MTHHFRYHNTNCFFIGNLKSERLIAFDAGWPCTLYEYQRRMKEVGLRFADIQIAMVSHFHMDHAGLIGGFQEAGIQCFAFPGQKATIVAMEKTILKSPEYNTYTRIQTASLVETGFTDFNAMLSRLGFSGMVIPTPGHSDDSVSFITGGKEALIGDLPPLGQVMPDDLASNGSWDAIRKSGAVEIYPSHAGFFRIQRSQ